MESAAERICGLLVRQSATDRATRSRGLPHDLLRQQIQRPRFHFFSNTTQQQTPIRQAPQDRFRAAYRPFRMAEIFCRASAQGTGFTLPESKSWMRRAISFCHSSSAPSSTVSSRLSRREPASAARAPAGSASAFFNSSESSSAIVAFYPRNRRYQHILAAASCEQKFLSPQFLDRIPQLSRLLKFKPLGRLPHVTL